MTWTRRFHHRRRANEVQCRLWRAAAFGQLSGSWTQIWRRNGAFPILPSEPVGMSHNQFPPPQQCHKWSDVDPDGRDLEFVQQFQECTASGSPCVLVMVNWCATGLEPGMPLKHLCTTQAFAPKTGWIILMVSVALFPRLAQNLMHTRCSFLWSIVKIATGHVHDSKQKRVKTAQSTHLCATWHTVSLDMVVLPYTGASRYHNCCIDGGTTLENFGYHLVDESSA